MKKYNGDGSLIEAAPQIPIVADVQIQLFANGQIKARTSANRPQFNMMMITAMQDLVEQLKEQEGSNRVVQAPPGLRID